MKIALLGNPNTGKSSIFNLLTGLRQHIGNFPGVTVEKKEGLLKIGNHNHQLIDFPGTYSIYPHSEDEKVVFDVLSNPKHPDYPEVCVVVLDASNLRRNLLLFTQIYDLGLPTVMLVNMIDIADKIELSISENDLKEQFPSAQIVFSNARIKLGRDRILDAITKATAQQDQMKFAPNCSMANVEDIAQQEREAEERYKKIDEILPKIQQQKIKKPVVQSFSTRLDKILTHKIFGYLIFAFILLLIFQFIFSFASIPMDFIDTQFGNLAEWTASVMPDGLFNDLLAQGIIPGIGGVVIFVPQIAILFFFLSILEETGYMSRVVFIMDRLMRPFGLNGKSVVPLMSGIACAIPGVMAARTISDWKERMITIMVTPLMSCSARIPVYTLLIALVIPNQRIFGVFNLQGLVLFGLYFMGLFAALSIAALMKFFIKTKTKGYLLLEMPAYKQPRWGNVGITVFEKVKVFVINAGKIILAISIVLWALAKYGPADRIENAVETAQQQAIDQSLDEEETADLINGAQLQNSYIGILGKTIEPVIAPLGYDWKMGISLITSFAAREVFVGSLATIYSVHDDGEENVPLREKLLKEKHTNGKSVYTLASGVSLMVFYVFAMQCMATMAVVKRETGSWKWTFLQLGLFGALAYIGAFIAFHILS